MSTKILNFLRDTYSKAEARAKYKPGNYRIISECNKGVRQGCPVSPILFALYTSDLMKEYGHGVMLANRKLPGLMFADDIALLADTPVNLQSALDKLHIYCEKWALKVNKKKTKVMVHGWSFWKKDCCLVLQ